ncbi:MAG: flagellar biosynthetic protein FliO [Firmicutes bacterium]|nr:flagellar biosynthetic protein FliO [Bacillota bacterium]
MQHAAAAEPSVLQALGQQATSPANAAGGGGPSVLLVVLETAAILAFILALAWLAKRLLGKERTAHPKGLQVEAELRLDAHHRLVIVTVEDQRLLLGVGESITLITVLEAGETIAPFDPSQTPASESATADDAKSRGFAAILAEVQQRYSAWKGTSASRLPPQGPTSQSPTARKGKEP